MDILARIPTDVLLAICDAVSRTAHASDDPSSALATHIAVSRTCRALRALYAFASPAAEDAFWKAACAAAGFGRPLLQAAADADAGEPLPSWRELALLLVAHREVCEIRSCRDASGWLGPHRRSSTRHHTSTSSTNTCRASRRAPTFHPLFYYLHCCPRTRTPDAAAVLLTHLPTVPGGRMQAYAPLAGHARASCAFATEPPVRTITLVLPRAGACSPVADENADDDDEDAEADEDEEQEEEEEDAVVARVHNPDGVTLLDVNRLLASALPRSATDAHAVMAHYHALLEAYRAPGVSFAGALRAGAHRGFLRDHEYPYLHDGPMPGEDGEDDAFGGKGAATATSAGNLAVRCSNGARRRQRPGFFVRGDLKLV